MSGGKVVALGPEDITDEDRALVADFYKEACHAEWCEFDDAMIEYVAARSRLNGAAVAFGLVGMAEAIRAKEDARQRQKDFEDRMLEADMGQ